MIYQISSIILQSGKMAAYREIENDLKNSAEKFGIKTIGSWSTVYGNVNEVTLLVAYEDMGKLEKSNMAMMQDKEFQSAVGKLAPFIVSQTRKLMMPTPASPLK